MPDAVLLSQTSIGRHMNFVLQPWQLLLLILAGWINRKQQDVIDYLKTENEVLSIGSISAIFLSSGIAALIPASDKVQYVDFSGFSNAILLIN